MSMLAAGCRAVSAVEGQRRHPTYAICETFRRAQNGQVHRGRWQITSLGTGVRVAHVTGDGRYASYNGVLLHRYDCQLCRQQEMDFRAQLCAALASRQAVRFAANSGRAFCDRLCSGDDVPGNAFMGVSFQAGRRR